MTATVWLRAGGVAMLIAVDTEFQPEIRYWGKDLGELSDDDASAAALAVLTPTAHAVADVRIARGLIPEAAAGYRGRPGLSGFRRGASVAPRFRLASLDQVSPSDGAPASLAVVCDDEQAGLRLSSEFVLDGHGTLRVRHEVTNTGDDPLRTDRSRSRPADPPAGPGDRRLHRKVVIRARRTAAAAEVRRLDTREPSGPYGRGLGVRDHGRYARLPAPGRRGVGGAPGLERRLGELGRVPARQHPGRRRG